MFNHGISYFTVGPYTRTDSLNFVYKLFIFLLIWFKRLNVIWLNAFNAVAFQSPQNGFPWWMTVRGHRLTVGNLIASHAHVGHAKTLLNCVPTRTKVNSTKSQLPTNCSALARLPAPLVLINKREWDVCVSVDILVVRGKLLNHNWYSKSRRWTLKKK